MNEWDTMSFQDIVFITQGVTVSLYNVFQHFKIYHYVILLNEF
jgi:hypothetical protein